MQVRSTIYRAVAVVAAVSTLTAGLAGSAWGHHRDGHDSGRPTPTPTASPSPTPVMVTVTLDIHYRLSPKGYDPCPVEVLEGSGPEAVLDAAVAAGCVESYEVRYEETPWGSYPYLACIDGTCNQRVEASVAASVRTQWSVIPDWRGFVATEGSTLAPYYLTYVCTFWIGSAYLCVAQGI